MTRNKPGEERERHPGEQEILNAVVAQEMEGLGFILLWLGLFGLVGMVCVSLFFFNGHIPWYWYLIPACIIAGGRWLQG